jgi:hypothetical protein
MSYSITFEPLNRIAGVKPQIVSIGTAAGAWAEVQMLQASDARVEIRDPGGRIMTSRELRRIAEAEIA